MSSFNVITSDDQCTVVSEYEPLERRSDAYQSEAALEKEFIRMLIEQGYEYIRIDTEKDLVSNLRRQLEKLNGIDNMSAWPCVVWTIAREEMRKTVRGKIRTFGSNGRA